MARHSFWNACTGMASWMLGIAVVTIGLAVVSGCSDHRISQSEFEAIQRETQAQTPATQPAIITEPAKASIEKALGPYRVGPDDVLRIALNGLEKEVLFIPVDVRVTAEGDVELPGVGRVHIGGLQLGQVEQMVQKAYVPQVYRQAVVHVTLVEPETTGVLVIGAVTQPGLVQLKRTQRNLLYAIVAAGGVSDVASGQVELERLRRSGEPVTLTLTEPEGLRTALGIEPLETGDIIKVHAAVPNTIFVGGLVNAPRPQIFPAGVPVTVLQALASSGGLRTDVTPREATLIRRMPTGQDVHVRLNLDRMTTGQDANLTLAAGDILWVPESMETRIQDWINKNVFFRVGGSATANYGFNYNSQGLNYVNSTARQSQMGSSSQSLQDKVDPFGFLLQNQGLQALQQQMTP